MDEITYMDVKKKLVNHYTNGWGGDKDSNEKTELKNAEEKILIPINSLQTVRSTQFEADVELNLLHIRHSMCFQYGIFGELNFQKEKMTCKR